MKPLLLISIALLCARHLEAANPSAGVLSDEQIRQLIEQHRPSRGGAIPPDLKYRLGATHMDGHYCFTTEPYIIEGARQVQGLGYGILKLWFAKADGNQRGYRYNSNWNLTKTMTFRDLAAHPYYQEVFAMPFKVFALNINEGFGGASTEDQTPTLHRIEQEFYELTIYLLTQYKTREVTFILEMWEGDWTDPRIHAEFLRRDDGSLPGPKDSLYLLLGIIRQRNPIGAEIAGPELLGG